MNQRTSAVMGAAWLELDRVGPDAKAARTEFVDCGHLELITRCGPKIAHVACHVFTLSDNSCLMMRSASLVTTSYCMLSLNGRQLNGSDAFVVGACRAAIA